MDIHLQLLSSQKREGTGHIEAQYSLVSGKLSTVFLYKEGIYPRTRAILRFASGDLLFQGGTYANQTLLWRKRILATVEGQPRLGEVNIQFIGSNRKFLYELHDKVLWDFTASPVHPIGGLSDSIVSFRFRRKNPARTGHILLGVLLCAELDWNKNIPTDSTKARDFD